MTSARHRFMRNKTRKQIKKTTKALRKVFKKAGKQAGTPMGIASGALALGGLAAVVAFDPEVRERSRAFAGAARDFFLRAGRQAKDHLDDLQGETKQLETTHH